MDGLVPIGFLYFNLFFELIRVVLGRTDFSVFRSGSGNLNSGVLNDFWTCRDDFVGSLFLGTIFCFV